MMIVSFDENFVLILLRTKPLRYGTVRERYSPGIRDAGKTIDPSVGCFPVAIGAIPVFNVAVNVRLHGGKFGVGNEFYMTSPAVLINDILTCLLNENNLGLEPECKHGGVPQAVFGFKEIVIGNVVVRYMTIIAIGPLPVGTMAPCGILRSHYVTIHTCRGLIRKIGGALDTCITKAPNPANIPSIIMTGNFHRSGGINHRMNLNCFIVRLLLFVFRIQAMNYLFFSVLKIQKTHAGFKCFLHFLSNL